MAGVPPSDITANAEFATSTIHNGEGLHTPGLLTPVDIKYTAISRDDLLLSSTADLINKIKLCTQHSVVIGRKQATVPYCVYSTITTMKKREIKLIPLTLNATMKCLQVYKPHISSPPSHISALIELCAFNRLVDLPDWEPTMKMKEARIQKSLGNDCFRSHLIAESAYHYSIAAKLSILSDHPNTDRLDLTNNDKLDHPSNDKLSLTLTCLLNLSACWLQFGEYNYVLELCKKVLSHESNNEKALYRQAVALSRMNEFDSAIASLNRLIQLNPANTEAVTELKNIDYKKREYFRNEATKYSTLFSAK